MLKAKRGRPKKENNCNEVCRICNLNLRVTYGDCGTKSCANLFKPSTRKETFGVVWSERLKNVGFTLFNVTGVSQVVCNGCCRKINNFYELFHFLKRHLTDEKSTSETENYEGSEGAKRKFGSVLQSPARSSPPNKSLRTQSPGKGRNPARSRKSLGFQENGRDAEFASAVHSNVLSNYNVDDMNTTDGSAAVKVVICYPSGQVAAKNSLDKESQNIIRNISLQNWRTAVNACFSHENISPELKEEFARQIERECKEYTKSDSCLKGSSPDQLAVFSNKTVCKEVETYCPLLYTALSKAANINESSADDQNERVRNAIALATSSLIRCRNSTMSAVAYRISTVLFHSGVSFRDFTRLNHLGVCMSHQMMIDLQKKMGENYDFKAIIWKKTIEENKCAKLLVEEIKETQLPPKGDDDMDLVVEVDVSEETIRNYEWYSPENYQRAIAELNKTREIFNEPSVTSDHLDETLTRLGKERLPFFK